jgi:hypothetical protein
MFENKDIIIWLDGKVLETWEELFEHAAKLRTAKCESKEMDISASLLIQKGRKNITGKVVLVG